MSHSFIVLSVLVAFLSLSLVHGTSITDQAAAGNVGVEQRLQINVFLFELVGAQAQNRLILAKNAADLEKSLLDKPDLLMVTRRDGQLPQDVAEIISRAGYTLDTPSMVGDSTLWVAKR